MSAMKYGLIVFVAGVQVYEWLKFSGEIVIKY